MKNLKRKVILIFTILMMACVSFLAITPVFATAGTSNVADTVSFNFEQGASVRMVKENAGLRFRALMPTEEYLALENNTSYSDVSYGMIIVPKDFNDAVEITKASVFGNSATYTVDENVSGKKYVINLTSDVLFDYIDGSGNNYKSFNGVITNILQKNYVREFVAVSYIKYTLVGGQTDYVFKGISDARSVVYVSQIALQNNVKDTDNILSGFISVASNIDTTYTVEHYKDGVKQEFDTQILTAKIGAIVTPTAKNYVGYDVQPLEETEVLANGKTVIRIDYTIKELTNEINFNDVWN